MTPNGRSGAAARVLLAITWGGVAASPASAQTPPLPDPNFATTVLPRPCAYEGGDPYEADFYEVEGWTGPDYERYPGACQRMRFSYGPIVVKPGQNDVLVGPVTIEKPMQDGYITRFKPEPRCAPTARSRRSSRSTCTTAPGSTLTDEYGSGPFFAAGEEKTIAPFPRGYGMPIKATDQWQLLYMVHSAVAAADGGRTSPTTSTSCPQAKAPAARHQAAPTRSGSTCGPSGYPVFNVQRAYGGADGDVHVAEGEVRGVRPVGQDRSSARAQPGNGIGEDCALPSAGEPFGRIENFRAARSSASAATCTRAASRNEIDLVRDGEAKRIYTGEAAYWDRGRHDQAGRAADLVGLLDAGHRPAELGRARRARRHPAQQRDLRHDDPVDLREHGHRRRAARARRRRRQPDRARRRPVRPRRVDTSDRLRLAAACRPPTPTLCDKGMRRPTATTRRTTTTAARRASWTRRGARPGRPSEVGIADFLYAPGDLSMISMTASRR